MFRVATLLNYSLFNSCAWSLTAERGQQISVSWRLPGGGGGGGGGQTRLRRPVGPCPATIVFVDGDDDDDAVAGGRQLSDDGRAKTRGSSLHATTCSVGSRTEPRLIYTSKTSQLYVRPTDAIINRLLPLSHSSWKPYLIEYRSTSTTYVHFTNLVHVYTVDGQAQIPLGPVSP